MAEDTTTFRSVKWRPVSEQPALTCPTCGRSDTVCGMEYRGVYDGVLHWECMEDGAIWHRWPEGHHMYAKAAEQIRKRRPGGPSPSGD